MTISDKGMDLIKKFEGLRLKAYRDAVGVWTIGYGHTGGVAPGTIITEEIANHLLEQDLAMVEICVNEAVSVPLTQNGFDALVSFVFNVGCFGFRKSTLLRLLNKGEYKEIADQFRRWNKGRINGLYVELPGLTKRRQAEAVLFSTPDGTNPRELPQ